MAKKMDVAKLANVHVIAIARHKQSTKKSLELIRL
jgi:hypothetical protein